MRRLALGALLAACAFSTAARAQGPDTRAAARALGDEALDRFDAGDYAGALDRFERADALVHLPTTGLWVARSLVRLGRLLDAENRYVDVARIPLPPGAPEVFVRAQADAATERAELGKRIPHLTIEVEGARGDATVELDGHSLPRALEGVSQPVDPGAHQVRLLNTPRPDVRRVVVVEGAIEHVVLRAMPPSSPPALVADATPSVAAGGRPLRTAGLITVSTGGALAVAGAVFGVLAIEKHDQLAPSCPGGVCPPPYHHDASVLDDFRAAASVGLIGGVVLAAAGAALLLISPHDRGGAALELDRSGLRIAF